jgi:hypothetical protein
VAYIKASDIKAGDVLAIDGGDRYMVTAVEQIEVKPTSGYETDRRLPEPGPRVRLHYKKYAPSIHGYIDTYRDVAPGLQLSDGML